MKFFFIFLYLPFLFFKSDAQGFNTDSALQVINKMKEDTSKVIALRSAGLKIEETDTARSKIFYWEATQLSKKLKDEIQLSRSLCSYGSWHINLSHYDTAEQIYRSAYQAATSANSPGDQAIASSNIGNSFIYRTMYDSALYYYLIAGDFFEKNKDYRRAALQAANLSALYAERKVFAKAIESGQKAIELAIRSKDTIAIGRSYGSLGNALYADSSFAEAGQTFIKALPFLKKVGVLNFVQIAYNNLSACYYDLGDYQLSDLYADSSLALAIQLGKPISLANAYQRKGRVAVQQNHFPEAEKFYALALGYSKQVGSDLIFVDYYNNIAELHYAEGKYKEAYNDRFMRDQYNEKVRNSEMLDKMQEMEAVYQSSKKQSQINQLEKEKELQRLSIKQKSTFNALLIIALFAAVIIGFLYYRNVKRKQQLIKQTGLIKDIRIKELEQEKQFVAVNSILQGQEAERSRMAKDLHDGLGGMLSGIKLNLSSMKGNMIIHENDANLFNKSLVQLDNAISEMRRVAHNMMPEALLKFGLPEAVQDFCDGINETNLMKMKFTQIGFTQSLQKPTEVILYRIIQELSNNALKHAAAKNIFIQLTKHERGITLTVEDDGKGFDATKLANMAGVGLQNVQSRVDYLKGSFTIDSIPGKGSSANVEIPFENIA